MVVTPFSTDREGEIVYVGGGKGRVEAKRTLRLREGGATFEARRDEEVWMIW